MEQMYVPYRVALDRKSPTRFSPSELADLEKIYDQADRLTGASSGFMRLILKEHQNSCSHPDVELVENLREQLMVVMNCSTAESIDNVQKRVDVIQERLDLIFRQWRTSIHECVRIQLKREETRDS